MATLVAGSVVVAGLGAGACTESTPVNASLVSGMFINTSLLIGGYTCGVADGDVYKYVAVVINDKRQIAAAGVFDCFADGVFANLPGVEAGTISFGVWVYAYDKAHYDQANAKNELVNAAQLLNGVTQLDGAVTPVNVNIVPDGGPVQGGYPAALSIICRSPANYSATCAASSQAGVQFLAYCNTLAPAAQGASSCALDVRLPDAGPG